MLLSKSAIRKHVVLPGVLQSFTWVTSAGSWACAQLLKPNLTTPTLPDLTNCKTPALLFCNAWCLHEAAKAHLFLEDRCFDLKQLEQTLDSGATLSLDAASTPDADSTPQSCQSSDAYQGLRPFIISWCRILCELLVQKSASMQPSAASRAELADAVDGRLWHFMTCCLLTATPPGLPGAALQHAQQLMHAICQLAGLPAQAHIIFLDTWRLSESSHHPQQQSSNSPEAAGALLLTHNVHGNAFVDAFLGPQADPGQHQKQDLLPIGSTEVQAAADFDEAYHWHTGRPLEPTYLGKSICYSQQSDSLQSVSASKFTTISVLQLLTSTICSNTHGSSLPSWPRAAFAPY